LGLGLGLGFESGVRTRIATLNHGPALWPSASSALPASVREWNGAAAVSCRTVALPFKGEGRMVGGEWRGEEVGGGEEEKEEKVEEARRRRGGGDKRERGGRRALVQTGAPSIPSRAEPERSRC
jgi:hypothetical protein